MINQNELFCCDFLFVVSDEKTGGNVKFKFKKFAEGEYVLQVTHDQMGSAEMIVALAEKQDVGDIALSTKKPAPPTAQAASLSESKKDTRAPDRISVTVPQTMEAMGSPSKDFILNELNFEIKKLSAEFKHLTQELDHLKALSKMWVKPLQI